MCVKVGVAEQIGGVAGVVEGLHEGGEFNWFGRRVVGCWCAVAGHGWWC